MPLAPGTSLGPYEIVGPLGAGGMGEVYRARDTRLDRAVAVKVLPDAFAADSDRLRRFEREARAIAALSHPNILTLFDVGHANGTTFMVTELVAGKTLREWAQSGSQSVARVTEVGAQIAEGLAAAHELQIVHRDLKPSNVMVTDDGRVKLLDFGLAHYTEQAASNESTTQTAEATRPGLVLGTMGYMAPEQVRGESPTPRTDIFALGVILYEVLTGTNPFLRDTAAETIGAVLHDDPPPPGRDSLDLPQPLISIVRRCVEKQPGARFQSARDLAFALRFLASTPLAGSLSQPSVPLLRSWLPVGLAMAAGVAVGLGITALVPHRGPREALGIEQLTWRTGIVLSGRFAPDYETVVYGARWSADPVRLFTGRLGSVESRLLGAIKGTVVGISSAGDMALLEDVKYDGHGHTTCGTLTLSSLSGGAPRAVLDNVRSADFLPGSRDLAVARCGASYTVEFPAGKRVFESSGQLHFMRASPDGSSVAAFEYPTTSSRGWLIVVDRNGHRTVLTELLFRPRGLVWAPSGTEVWFASQTTPGVTSIEAVDVKGHRRIVERMPGWVILQDVAPDGRLLVTNEHVRVHAVASALATGGVERELSWLDGSNVTDISEDGRRLLMYEAAGGGGKDFAVYVRPTDGSDATRLGEGASASLTGDGQWALVWQRARMVAIPTGPGSAVPLGADDLSEYGEMAALGRSGAAFVGLHAKRGWGLYVQEIGQPAHQVPLPAAPDTFIPSPDGARLLLHYADRGWAYHRVDGSRLGDALGIDASDHVYSWARDGLYVSGPACEMPCVVERVDPVTGVRRPWRTIMAADPTGLDEGSISLIVKDTNTYAYGYMRFMSDLLVLEGLR